MSRRLLVTGGAGFIGSAFCEYWSAAYPQDRVVVLDALTYAGNLTNLTALIHQGLRFVRAEIGDTPSVLALLQAERIDTLVNFAAETHVDRSIDDPRAFVRTNVLGTQGLLEAARAHALRDGSPFRFHHISTDEVYGTLGPADPPFTEQHPYAPRSPYAASKAAADHLVRAYGVTYGLAYTISNCSNNYGPRQYPEKLLPLFILNLLAGRMLPVYGDGLQVRDWLHVRDHCRAIDLILGAAAGQTYNIGGGCELANLRIIERLCELVDGEIGRDASLATRFPDCPASRGRRCRELIQFVRDRPGHDRRYAIDARKIERELGFRPEITLEEGLATTFAWYLQHEDWWREILARGDPAAVRVGA